MSVPPLALAVIPVSFAAAWALTAMIRRYALTIGLVDRPNDRSSHTVPTPRGGGVAIVATFVVLAFATRANFSWAPAMALLGGSALVAVLGFVDDRRPLAARWRFGGHVLAATGCVLALGVPMLPSVAVAHLPGAGVTVGAIVLVIWTINLYNFMDGIDGIAGVEAITVCLGGALLWWWVGSSTGWVAALLLASCVAGFLVWNFPPAKIFMGDAGSGFLGLVIAVLSLWAGQDHPPLFWSWLILLGCFMVDATVTLVRRVLRGEKFYLAHRSHAYQYASRIHRSHKVVTLTVGAINVVWLFPIALAVAVGWIDGLVGLIVAYSPLIALAFRYKAGDRDGQGANA
jgi:Fuc2NAc and GlcNAc transferase